MDKESVSGKQVMFLKMMRLKRHTTKILQVALQGKDSVPLDTSISMTSKEKSQIDVVLASKVASTATFQRWQKENVPSYNLQLT